MSDLMKPIDHRPSRRWTPFTTTVVAIIVALTLSHIVDRDRSSETLSTFRAQNLLVDDTTTLGGQFAASGTLTIATWTTGQTLVDWNPTGLGSAYVISVQQSSGTTNITGLVAQPIGTEVTIYNREASVGTITLQYETGSAPGNQLVLPGAAAGGFPWDLQPGASITLRYGGSNWQFKSSGTYQFPVVNTRFGANLNGTTNIQQLRYTEQLDSSIGTQNDFTLFNSTTVLAWSGASDATFTGMIGGASGRVVIITNTSNGHNLTLANQNGGSTGQHQYLNTGLADVTLIGNTTGIGSPSSATYEFDGVNLVWHLVSFTSSTSNVPMTFASTKNKGTITLGGGTGTATVNSGAVCTCTDSTANASVKCAVAATTLTATGTGTDTIAYLCF